MLEPRDEYGARFASWQAQAVLEIAAGPDRAHVRAYATWRVAHKLARAGGHRAESSYSSLKYAKSQVVEAIKLVCWLHEQELELADLRQDLVDDWIAGGSIVRRRIRPFVQWLERAGVTGCLEVEWDNRLPTRPSLSDDQRFALLHRFLHDPEIEMRDRFAGAVLLLYGRPFTHIASLKTTAIGVEASGQATLRLARGETPLPEPVGAIALALRDQRVLQLGAEGWLFGGRHAGTHITADRLRCRLKRYGIERSTEGRHGALLALAARIPAPILAERTGIHQARAAQWVRLAGGTYADYVHVRSTGH